MKHRRAHGMAGLWNATLSNATGGGFSGADVVNGVLHFTTEFVRNDDKIATVIMFALFIMVLMVVTVVKECTDGNRRRYQKGMVGDEEEGVELCIVKEEVLEVDAQVADV